MTVIKEKLESDSQIKRDGNFIRNQILKNSSMLEYFNNNYIERETQESFYKIGRVLDQENGKKYNFFKNS